MSCRNIINQLKHEGLDEEEFSTSLTTPLHLPYVYPYAHTVPVPALGTHCVLTFIQHWGQVRLVLPVSGRVTALDIGSKSGGSLAAVFRTSNFLGAWWPRSRAAHAPQSRSSHEPLLRHSLCSFVALDLIAASGFGGPADFLATFVLRVLGFGHFPNQTAVTKPFRFRN